MEAQTFVALPLTLAMELAEGETPLGSQPSLRSTNHIRARSPGLGVVAISLVQRGAHGIARVLAQGYPRRPQVLGPLLAVLADHYVILGDMRALGWVWLDANGGLGAPATALH